MTDEIKLQKETQVSELGETVFFLLSFAYQYCI